MAGAGVYTYQLVRALADLDTPHEIVVFARPELFDGIPNLRVHHVQPAGRAMRLAWEQTVLPLLLRREQIDVLHSPHHHTPIAAPLVSRVRRVVTIHDVTFLLLVGRYPRVRRLYMTGLTKASARAADAFITPSETVRADAIRKLGIPADRVAVVHEAAGRQFKPSSKAEVEDARMRYGLPERFILSVGSLEPGKNRERLMRAFASLSREGDSCQLAIVGKPAWHYESDYEVVRELGLDGRVRFLGYVANDDLPPLYTGALLLAFPSLYEGFGLPVLEAMACGTPVVTSNVSATAEVAGNAALLVDPTSTASIADALVRVLADEGLRADLHRRGIERSREFSWDRTARETLAVYERVASK